MKPYKPSFKTQKTLAEEFALSRKPYAKPCLVILGDVRDMTLGGSPGAGDSGATDFVENPKGDVWDIPDPIDFGPGLP